MDQNIIVERKKVIIPILETMDTEQLKIMLQLLEAIEAAEDLKEAAAPSYNR